MQAILLKEYCRPNDLIFIVCLLVFWFYYLFGIRVFCSLCFGSYFFFSGYGTLGDIFFFFLLVLVSSLAVSLSYFLCFIFSYLFFFLCHVIQV
jgi:hypothetical protein